MKFFAGLLGKLRCLLVKDTPNAARHWAREGGAALHYYWLYATPVHVRLGSDSYFVVDADLMISVQESQALIASLNDYFIKQGYTFYLSNHTWFVGMDYHPNITTTPINEVMNQDVAAFLPKGGGALAWAKLQNEIQMLLFNHPVNKRRAKRGKLALNSIWFYGETAR